jgi:uncharacterized membrane protein YhaH (DUF805 family)
MKIEQAVEICVTQKYADFTGSASRSEYWWFLLFLIVIDALVSVAFKPLSGVFGLAMFVPLMAVGTRRLHDIGRSGWWQVLWLLPAIGWIILWIMLARPGSTPTTPL